MNMKNWPPQKLAAGLEINTPEHVETELEDMDRELLELFRHIPKPLWVQHFNEVMEIKDESGDESAVATLRKAYMEVVIQERENAMVAYRISDEGLRQQLPETRETADKLARIIQKAFQGAENLGNGTTARVKRMRIEGLEKPLAVKYLLAPKESTLSAEAEHDMLGEVERIIKIEEAEGVRGIGSRIRVPHPYLYFERGKLQCYAMSEVEGVTFETLLHSKNVHIAKQDAALKAVRERYATPESQQELFDEVDAFIDEVHKVCLHGDLKAKNIMIDTDGVIHLIDFGQSVAVGVPTEAARDQFEDLKDQERSDMHTLVRALLSKAFASKDKQEAA